MRDVEESLLPDDDPVGSTKGVLERKLRSLTRNQTVGFGIGVAGLVATLWFGISSVAPRAPKAQTNHVQ